MRHKIDLQSKHSTVVVVGIGGGGGGSGGGGGGGYCFLLCVLETAKVY